MEAIHPFGVFVEVLPGQSGLVHVSELDTERTNDPADKVCAPAHGPFVRSSVQINHCLEQHLSSFERCSSHAVRE